MKRNSGGTNAAQKILAQAIAALLDITIEPSDDDEQLMVALHASF